MSQLNEKESIIDSKFIATITKVKSAFELNFNKIKELQTQLLGIHSKLDQLTQNPIEEIQKYIQSIPFGNLKELIKEAIANLKEIQKMLTSIQQELEANPVEIETITVKVMDEAELHNTSENINKEALRLIDTFIEFWKRIEAIIEKLQTCTEVSQFYGTCQKSIQYIKQDIAKAEEAVNYDFGKIIFKHKRRTALALRGHWNEQFNTVKAKMIGHEKKRTEQIATARQHALEMSEMVKKTANLQQKLNELKEKYNGLDQIIAKAKLLKRQK